MRVLMVTPAPRGSRSGNRLTALRWAVHLRALGHEVELHDAAEVDVALAGDLLIALHAEKSAGALHRWCEREDAPPAVLVMTGTDLYATDELSDVALESCDRADRIVVLHPGALDRLPADLHARVHCIPQSAVAPRAPRARQDDRFLALSLAHLRPVKDPLLLARAARLVPRDSRLLAQLAGASADDDFADLVRAEERDNERFQWIGALQHKDAMERLASADLLVVTSRNEGRSRRRPRGDRLRRRYPVHRHAGGARTARPRSPGALPGR